MNHNSSHISFTPVPYNHHAYRLSGALAATTVKRYVAFDPNRTLRPGYAEIAGAFEVETTRVTPGELQFANGFEIRSQPFEVGSLSLSSGSFDLVFTSPPFFDYEMYNPDNPDYTDWISEFYVPLMQQSYRCVRPGIFITINV
jgi:hypothetical protein